MNAPVNDPVNLGNPRELTLLELAKHILEISGSKSEIVYRPLPVDDPKVRQPDISRARRLLELGAHAGGRRGTSPDDRVVSKAGPRAPGFRKELVHDRRGAARHPGLPGLQGELIFEETRIICPACRKAYPVRDGIPVMLIGEAEPWTPTA